MINLKILICGGGIAGNAVAFWLSKLGHDVTLIERLPSLRSTGLQLDLRGHGVEVMRRMGLEQAFRAKTVNEQGLQIVDRTGKVRAYFPANRTGKGLQSFTTDFEIMRGDFVQILYNATREKAKYVFGISVESFEQYESSVEVLFSDGKRDRFDLLVGADGQGSHTRRMMLGPGKPDPIHFLGQYMGYFTIPRDIQEGEEYIATSYVAPGKRFLLTRRHNPHQVQVYMSCDSTRLKNITRGDVEKEKEAMAEIFLGAGWQTPQILEALKLADDFYLERPGVVRLDTWSNCRVVLVGDAAYCPTANTGMGTTSSLVGAYILAGEIAKHCGNSGTKDDLPTALSAYERKFRPFMDQVQHAVAEDSHDWMMPTGTIGIAILNFVVGIAAFLRLDILGRFVLREDVKNWALPDYNEMVCGDDCEEW